MKALNKSELIDRLFEQHLSLSNREARAAVDEVLRAIVRALGSGIRVEYRGFGTFSVKWHGPRQGRNPKTGVPVPIPGKYVPRFQAGKMLRDALNEKARGEDQA